MSYYNIPHVDINIHIVYYYMLIQKSREADGHTWWNDKVPNHYSDHGGFITAAIPSTCSLMLG